MTLRFSLSQTTNVRTESLLDRLPDGTFYLDAPTHIPNYFEPVAFELEVDTLPSELTLTVVYKTSGRPAAKSQTTIHPAESLSIVYVHLFQGLNRVHLKSVDGIVDQLILCSNNGTMLYGIGDELYDFSWVPYDNLVTDLENPFGSRMIEHMLPYQDMLPQTNSVRNIGARLCAKSSLAQPGVPSSPTDFLTGLLANTPEVVESLETERSLRPSLFYLRREALAFGGHDFHIWVPNTCVSHWMIATRFWDRTSPHSFKKVTETEVVVSENDTDSQHRFPDPLAGGCSSLTPEECIAIHTFGWLNRTFFALVFFGGPFPFDTVIEPCYALGRSTFDCGDVYDNGVLFDTIDDFDPTGDGWVGFPLSRRLDHPSCLDTCLVDIAEITECNSYFPVTPLENSFQTSEIDMEISSFGTVACVGGTCTF